MAIDPLYIGSDMDLDYSAATLSSTATPLNSGTCTYSLTDEAGTVLGTGTLTYVAASDGDYAGVIESTVTAALVADTPYTITITFAQSSYNDRRVISTRAAYRTRT